MTKTIGMLDMAGALARHASARQESISRNIANADTPGYKSRDISPFAQALDGLPELKATRLGHVHAAGAGNPVAIVAEHQSLSPNGNGVSLEAEMMKSAETRHQHDLAMSVYKSSLDIMRSVIGRR